MIVKKLRRVALVLGVGFLGLSTIDTSAQVQLIFQNGWENRTDLGCAFNTLIDGAGGLSTVHWNDFGPRLDVTCASPFIAQITTAERHDGNRSLQVNFRPDGSINGPDFRMGQDFGGNRNEIYARWYVKYSPNWRWATADHKVVIFGNASYTQDVYFNVRGNSQGGQGRIAIHAIPADVVFSDVNSSMSPGVWHLCEIHIVSGPNGRIEAKLDGQLLNLRDEGSRGLSPLNVNTGSGIGYFKLDTTYNNYAYPSSLGLNMNTWFDTFAISTQGWIGGTSGSGGSSSSAPTPPSNVRIVGS